MPLYEYRCRSCGKTFEKMQKFSDAPLKIHEDCGGALEKLISASAIKFKGTGWYVTDYAHGKSSSGAPNGKPAKSEDKSESKSESKTEVKVEKTPAVKSTPEK
jgi:putative FmdB family regulatory protein